MCLRMPTRSNDAEGSADIGGDEDKSSHDTQKSIVLMSKSTLQHEFLRWKNRMLPTAHHHHRQQQQQQQPWRPRIRPEHLSGVVLLGFHDTSSDQQKLLLTGKVEEVWSGRMGRVDFSLPTRRLNSSLWSLQTLKSRMLASSSLVRLFLRASERPTDRSFVSLSLPFTSTSLSSV